MAPAPRLYLRKSARADIAEAFRWYEARSAGLGFEFLRAVRVALAGVERAPEQYPVALDDIRKALLPRFPTSSTSSFTGAASRCSPSCTGGGTRGAGNRVADV